MATFQATLTDWLQRVRPGRAAPATHPTAEIEDAFRQLPKALSEKIVAAANELPSHPDEKKVILEALNQAIAQWQDRPHIAPNSMVILGHPVYSVSRILRDSLEEMPPDDRPLLPVKLLNWKERPPDISTFKQQLEAALGSAPKSPAQPLTQPFKNRLEGPVKRLRPKRAQPADSPATTSDPDERIPSEPDSEVSAYRLTVIPNLCWCFLRSADGLEGIDYLQDALLGDRSRFWVIGSGHVGWVYLESTLRFHAYCGRTVPLPKLTGAQLQSWLAPLIEQFNICFATPAPSTPHQPNTLLEEEQTDALKEEYFKRLANVSDGISSIALQFFLQSLTYFSAAPDEETSGAAPTETDTPYIMAQPPKAPTLPADLSQSDFYLLYSLMLHGDMTLRALAKSLGDAPQIVNNQMQVLRSKGIIKQYREQLNINPIYSLKLQQKLDRNNFILPES